MTPERIVRALAAAELALGGDGCRLCGPAGVEPEAVEDHEADCPWRLAVEWVAAQEDDGPPQGHLLALEAIPAGSAVDIDPATGNLRVARLFGLPVRLDPDQPRGTVRLDRGQRHPFDDEPRP